MKKETFNELKESLHQALEYERGDRTESTDNPRYEIQRL